VSAVPFDITKIGSMTAEEIAASPLTTEEIQQLYEYGRWKTRYPRECRNDLLKLVRYCMPDPEKPHHADYSRYHSGAPHKILAEAFESVLQGKCLRLIISVQPQIGKSTIAKHFLAAHVGRFPWKHLMAGTYNQTFADEYGDDVRSIINGEPFQRVYPGVELRTGSKAKDHMVTQQGGKLSFMGRGGSGTGRPADGFLIDDFFKDAAEAASKATRDAAWTWFTRVANTRCHALSWQVIIATRWSDDDIIARLTDPKNPNYDADVAKQWTVINLPAIVDREDLAQAIGIKVGEPLWPERFPLSLLETARKMDPVGFSALYMGRPTPPEGVFYRQADICEYHRPTDFPKRCRMYLTGDLAVSTENRADRSCIGMWGLDEDDTLWLHSDLFWDRKASDESVEILLDQGARYEVMEAWFEKGQLDKAIGPFLDKRQSEKGQQDGKFYFTISRLPVSVNKGLRSLSIRGRMRQGKVKFPAFAHWWSAAKEEMLKFTGSGDDKSDDFCDMVSLIGQALEMQVPASGAPTNVVTFPKVGTFGWTRRTADLEKAQAKLRANLRGM
jgi:predicted phage terminase large subunit-like protein